MPLGKPRASEIAAEAKRKYIPYCDQILPQYPAQSILIPDSNQIRIEPGTGQEARTRVAVIDGDPVDVALSWYNEDVKELKQTALDGLSSFVCPKIPVVNAANEKRAGGDWESATIAPEECLCRRSNLAKALVTPVETPPGSVAPGPHYPIPQRGGLYSPFVVIYRYGPDKGYKVWEDDFGVVPVISVAPVTRPKLDESGTRYSFAEEKELMTEKLRAILRIAAHFQYRKICVGAFGLGYGFRNPAGQLASMWKGLLFADPEFQGVFKDVVFAMPTGRPEESSSSPSSSSPTTTPASQAIEELEIFKRVFDPSSIFSSVYS